MERVQSNFKATETLSWVYTEQGGHESKKQQEAHSFSGGTPEIQSSGGRFRLNWTNLAFMKEWQLSVCHIKHKEEDCLFE